MHWTGFMVASAPLITLGRSHAVILNAQGVRGSPASVGFQGMRTPQTAASPLLTPPCQQDTTIIRDAEIVANVVNQCGRTELKGNIDVGENTENALSANSVTRVRAGGEITVTIHQVNADGAGPFFCDLDQTSNSGTNLQNLTVTNNVPGTNGLSQAKAQAFNITVRMPDDLKCTGASTGNVCTVRCRNNAVAGPFGGCFAVQQADTRPTSNRPGSITTEQSLVDVLSQVRQNQADFGVAVQANKDAGADEARQNLAAVEAILRETPTTRRFPQETPDVVRGGDGNGNGNKDANGPGKGNGNNNGNSNGNDNGSSNGNGNANDRTGNPSGQNRGSGRGSLNRDGGRNGQN